MKMEEKDLEKLASILKEFENKEGALIPILQKTQQEFGYLRREVLEEISKRTKIPLSKIYGVATFYAQFYLTKRGRNIIKVCRGTACHVKGGKSVKETVERILGISEGETTSDYKFTLETVACLGTCFLAPVMMINQSYYGKLTSKKVENILKNI
jgi:NADH-quinone oxidoreductase subunit E